MDRQISRKDFRHAMARVCAPVTVVTTDGLAGRGGFTAAAMCSVSDEPPTLLVCMNGRSSQCDLFLASRRFCANVFSDAHLHLAGTFAGAIRDMDERHAAAQWQTLASGTPVLSDAIVYFDCEIDAVHRIGTHNVMIGRVVDVRHGSAGTPLLYADRTYMQPTALGSFGG